MIRSGVAALILLLASTDIASADPAADARIGVDIRIAPTADGVAAKYRLARPVARFSLEYADGAKLRDRTWAVTTPGLSLEDGAVRAAGGREFSEFEVAVAARNELAGPYYPCVMKIGPSGRIIYASYFAGRQDDFRTTIGFERPQGAVVMGLPAGVTRLEIARTFFGAQGGPRYVFVGPRAYVRKSARADYVVGPQSPAWLEPEIRRIAVRVLPFYAAATRVALARKPLVLVTTESGDGPSMALQADVTDGPNVVFRFFGEGWAHRSAPAVKALDHAVAHETAHFWNAHHFASQKSDEAPWLHEGGAEYWAHVAQGRLGLNGEKDPTAALNRCIDLLGPDGLKPTHAKVAYACGETLQWFADLGEQAQGSDIFSLWREMFARAEANGRYYSAAMFRALAERTAPQMVEAFRLVFEPGDPLRWQSLPPLLAALGVTLEPAPFPPDGTRSRLIFHLLDQVCGGAAYGARDFDDHVVLDTGEDCGPLAGDPQVDAINGINLFADPVAAYDAVRAACESGGTLTLARAGSPERRTMTCALPLPPLPPAFKLARGG